MTAAQMKDSAFLAKMNLGTLEKHLRDCKREIKRWRRGSVGYNHFHDVIEAIQDEIASRGVAA